MRFCNQLATRSLLVFLYITGISFSLHAQSDSTYQMLIAKASLFHLQKNTKGAISLYDTAFQIQQPDALTAYKAAGMYSLDSNANKAFLYLDLALSSGWTEADWLSFDPYFDYLKITQPESWKKVEQQAFINEKRFAQTLQLPSLRKEINLMTLNDQKLRYARVQNSNDNLAQAIDQQINKSDYDNFNRAREIIKQYGWPKISQIGRDGQNNLWLIVQHADQDVLLQKSALFAMQKLSGKKEYNMENYAFLYDRVQCNLNYKQVYGTQVLWTSDGEASAFRPIISEDMVDERRRKLGLQPLKIYALTYGFTYQMVTGAESKQNDLKYNLHVRNLIDSAKYFYKAKEFTRTYDYYNTASTFIGGMNNADNFEAAILFSKIAALDTNGKYKSIALDFLDLLNLRAALTKSKLISQPEFKVLYKEPRWIALNSSFLYKKRP